ncbi:MAG: hypothetical protein A2X86_00650 [Bdellovibrionales bacterium GWA2_49_15]|nr:MAG: hypothetical protein A2X86_00650 [Bdellovibrionales bacterium GWA2_49_15]HAZ13226.1 hypothetical protein [Bdellovibrionales bacterium]
MGSMKDALLKAGIKPVTVENERPKRPVKEVVTKSVAHQMARDFCEVCEMIMPDVEKYRHRNPTTTAEWICIGCADKIEIHDDTRQTCQSEYAKKGIFKRFFGPTKRFPPGTQSPR